MCESFCVCVCRETMQQPGCTTSEPCFWARDLNFWRKTWPSWTGWRGDWQVGRRPPRLTRRCTIRGTDQGSRAPPSPPEPKHQPPGSWIKQTWLLVWAACERAEKEGQDCSPVDPVCWSQQTGGATEACSAVSRREWLVEDHQELHVSPCPHQLYFNMHSCFRHLCLIY